jgi:hypothetical protein
MQNALPTAFGSSYQLQIQALFTVNYPYERKLGLRICAKIK